MTLKYAVAMIGRDQRTEEVGSLLCTALMHSRLCIYHRVSNMCLASTLQSARMDILQHKYA